MTPVILGHRGVAIAAIALVRGFYKNPVYPEYELAYAVCWQYPKQKKCRVLNALLNQLLGNAADHCPSASQSRRQSWPVSYTHLRAHET